MYQAIFYKEWIKTRMILLLLLLVFAGMIAYSFINTAQLFRVAGAVNTWENTIMKDIPLISEMKWLPVLAGLLLAIVQYVPEMQNKRLKLTLHLPLPETRIIYSMLVYG